MPAKFKPYVVRDLYGIIKMDRVVVEPTFGGVRAIYRPLQIPDAPGVFDTSIIDERLPDGSTPYYERSNTALQSALADIKVSLLSHGGTPEAMRLFLALGEMTKKEIMMATEKLAGKGKAPAVAKAAPAAKAPAKGKAAPKDNTVPAEPKAKKALPPALQKAADAKKAGAAARDVLKVKVLTEKKANPYREGTKAYATFDLIKAYDGKTVGDIKAAATDEHDIGYLRYADRDGHIKVG